LIIEINFLTVFFDVESEYGIGLSPTINILALEGVAIIFSNPVHDKSDVLYTVSYAEVSRRQKLQEIKQEPLTRHVITIKQTDPNAHISAQELKKRIKSKINPSSLNIGVKNVRPINKGILIECDSQNDVNKLAKEINKKVQTVNVTIPQKKRLRVIITDISSAIDENSIIVKFFMKSKVTGRIHVILEVAPELYKEFMDKEKVNIGWIRCRVSKFLSVTQCFKCLGFNHTARDADRCSGHQHCSHCSREH
jgi:hypothetical protein